MTGALCVIAPGSSLQVMIAILVSFFYYSVNLRLAPYEAYSEDWTATFGAASYVLVTLAGFVLATENLKEEGSSQADTIGTLLVLMIVGTISFDVLVVLFVDYDVRSKFLLKFPKRSAKCAKACPGVWRRLCQGAGAGAGAGGGAGAAGGGGTRRTKVAPEKSKKKKSTLKASPSATDLKDIRLKYGASSKEYRDAASGLGNSKSKRAPQKSKASTKTNARSGSKPLSKSRRGTTSRR